MADHAEDDNADEEDIYLYRGGRAPEHVTHVIIDKSVNEIERFALSFCERLVKVQTHDGIRKVGKSAFSYSSLPHINLKSAVEISSDAFFGCVNLADVEFGDDLEIIREGAFQGCSKLKHLKLLSIVTIEEEVFFKCSALTDVEMSERLEIIGLSAFSGCTRLRRIAIPLKRDLFAYDDRRQRFSQFDSCYQLSTVDLVGGIHKSVASLHMESWRNDMLAEINHINRVLPNINGYRKTDMIQHWMESVLDRIHHYKADHCRYVKEAITLLELALWKAKLVEKEDKREGRTKKAKIDTVSARKGRRITCGADIVIKNVLPFLQLE